jgi:hypothetical protein
LQGTWHIADAQASLVLLSNNADPAIPVLIIAIAQTLDQKGRKLLQQHGQITDGYCVTDSLFPSY